MYLRPVRGCIKVGCVLAALAACCLGLLTLVLLLANSSRIVCGMSGSNLTPCCKIAHKKSDCENAILNLCIMYMCAVKIRVFTTMLYIFLCTLQSYYFIFAGERVSRECHEILDLVSNLLLDRFRR